MTSSALAGTPLANTAALARLAFRRDRIMLPVWVYVITAAIASNSYSLNKLYPTAAARFAAACRATTADGSPGAEPVTSGSRA